MPKRKAPTKISGLVDSDDDDLMQLTENESAPFPDVRHEPPVKKRRGRPRISHDDASETQPAAQAKKRGTTAEAPEEAPAVKKPGRRGRPRGSSRTADNAAGQARAAITQEPPEDEDAHDQENEDPLAPRDTKATLTTNDAKPAPARRGRGRPPNATKQKGTDGEFEYTPTRAGTQRQDAEPEVGDSQQNEEPAPEVVDEAVLPDPPPPYASSSVVKTARARLATIRNTQGSPQKRKSGVGAEQSGDPELRRRIGDLTKKHDLLESRYRNLREIGIVEANSNMEKLRKQCESITSASNELVASLKTELEAQRALAQQSRLLQKQLKERDTERAQLKSQADEAQSQLSSAQSEIKALQTKLAAARNTAASLESAVKVPGSAMKGGAANRATAAANAEASQIAQLKEELYSDLTGLIIRDVKNRESDHLYDCIQTGVNGTLHFKLAIPKVSTAEFESAEFQYMPLLDANRDRDLVNILPDFLTFDITFSRSQASKFYTRVIDALTKRRSSSAQQ